MRANRFTIVLLAVVQASIALRGYPQAAELHCVSVADNGDVTLTWTAVTDPTGTFEAYEVWSVDDGRIATLPTIAAESYTIVGASAHLASKAYFIQTDWSPAGGPPLSSSDTLSSIYLDLDDLGDGRILLTWNGTLPSAGGGTSPGYTIYREHPVGTWTIRGTVDQGTFQYLDTIDLCNASVRYRVDLADASGCSSTSNREEISVQDIINPYIPVLENASVDTLTGEVLLSWNRNAAPDTYGYVVHELVSGFWVPVDTAWGINTTTYAYAHPSVDSAPAAFRVTAFDACLSATVPPTYQTSALSSPHTTVHLSAQMDTCDRSLTLDWTPYVGWPTGVERYEVSLRSGGDPWEVVAAVGVDTLTYTYENMRDNTLYCCAIRAVSADGTVAYSNAVCLFVAPPSTGSFHYLATASYDATNALTVSCYTDPTAAVSHYEIDERRATENDFSYLGRIEPTTTDFATYRPATADPPRGPRSYRVRLVDICGDSRDTTQLATTVFSAVTTDHLALKNTLSWSPYEGFDGGVKEYRIYRAEEGTFSLSPLAVLPAGTFTYVDDVSSLLSSQGQFCYRVEAVESENRYAFAETAFSNAVCATLEPLIYVPNAFVIGGSSPSFLPVVSLHDFGAYRLRIYDRWGGVVFSTALPDQGWDGRDGSGRVKPEGIYLYHITVEDKEGKDYSRQGQLLLLNSD